MGGGKETVVRVAGRGSDCHHQGKGGQIVTGGLVYSSKLILKYM